MKKPIPPSKSYRIWFSQRNGSTLLCRALAATKLAGQPMELFNVDKLNLCEHYKVSNYKDLRQKLWELGTSDNGVFGVKNALYTTRLNAFTEELANLQNLEGDAEVVFADLFPNCKHIFLTRRNKVRQAVSWWKAIQDQVWHLEQGQSHQNDAVFYEKYYNFDALSHLFKEAVLRECNIQAYFSKYNITPLTLTYEDMLTNFENTLKMIFTYLEIQHTHLTIEIPLKKTADDQSEIWVQRFRKDLQAGWDKQIW